MKSLKKLMKPKREKPRLRALYIQLDPDLAKKMESHIDRPDGRTWRAFIEAMILRYLKEEEK